MRPDRGDKRVQRTFKLTLQISVALVLYSCAVTDVVYTENAVRVVRDEYGTPHVYAETIYGLYYGYGYSVAQDRLFQMEMARRSTQGTVAEIYGKEFADYDKATRSLFDPNSIRRQIMTLDPADREVFAGYAAGMNAWLAEVSNSPPELMPKQFVDLDFSPSEWTAYDVVMIFVGTMNNRYGDFNTELENAAILNVLVALHGENGGRDFFDLLNPRFPHTAPTTIPVENWSQPAYDSLALIGNHNPVALADVAASTSFATTGFSNCYVIGREKLVDGGAILVNGPQFGWFNPSYVYSIGLHGAGINVAGNSPFGYPMIMFGHNETISWGSTWGASDIVDVFQEQLNPSNSNEYLYKGEYVEFEKRREFIPVRNSVDIEFDVQRSVHGPIIETDESVGIAYAKHRSWDGDELETLLAWLYATWAPDFDKWKVEAGKSAINVNMYFADVDGNIGYFHGGKFPSRVSGHDNRLPAMGDGTMDWQGRQPLVSANPHVLNPDSGFLANWNNKPGQGVMNPDFFFYSWSAADRVDYLQQELEAQEQFTSDEAWMLIEKSSYADTYAHYFLPLIDAAVRGEGNGRLKEANDILQVWSRFSRDEDKDGYYDEAATPIFRTFITKLVDRVLRDDLGEAFPFFADNGYPTADKPTGAGTNIPPGVKAIYEALLGNGEYDVLNGETANDVVAAALRDAVMSLLESKGQALSDLRLPVAKRPFSSRNFLGIPQAGEDESLVLPIEQNRGTENNMIIMQRDNIVAWEVVAPGQSGFIDSAGNKSKHYSDQLEMYNEFGRKRVWFYPGDVAAHMQSEIRLTY